MTARRAFRDEWEPPSEGTTGLPLFSVTAIRTLARRDDPDTSKAAALAIADALSTLQARVYAAFQQHGAMTAKECERLPEFGDLGFSTARKRASELVARGWLRRTGVQRDGCDEMAIASDI